ncbi:hypothetical protein Tco_0502962 [Tanacetum coccineum]
MSAWFCLRSRVQTIQLLSLIEGNLSEANHPQSSALGMLMWWEKCLVSGSPQKCAPEVQAFPKDRCTKLGLMNVEIETHQNVH